MSRILPNEVREEISILSALWTKDMSANSVFLFVPHILVQSQQMSMYHRLRANGAVEGDMASVEDTTLW